MLKYEIQVVFWKFIELDVGKGFECVRVWKGRFEKYYFWGRYRYIENGDIFWRLINKGNKQGRLRIF